jgi:lysophospholipase L1-like esterase
MVPCLILGDSLAVGIGQYRPECLTVAQTGITSGRYIQTLLTTQTGNTAVISLGVNDADDMATLQNLRRVRASIHAKRVFWLLPGIKPRVREAVRTVAVEYDDFLVDTRFEAGADHLHPSGTGYRFLAAMVP